MNKDDIIPEGYARVTDVLEPYSSLKDIDPRVLEKAADRGTRVHNYCECYDLNLFVQDYDEDCKNYVEAYKKWFDDTVIEVVYSEKRLNSIRYRLSGKFDLVCRLKGDQGLSIVDRKTPLVRSPTWPLQTAAYKILLKDVMNVEVERRIALMLPKEGMNVTVCEYLNHERDESLYLKALELHRFFRLS